MPLGVLLPSGSRAAPARGRPRPVSPVKFVGERGVRVPLERARLAAAGRCAAELAVRGRRTRTGPVVPGTGKRRERLLEARVRLARAGAAGAVVEEDPDRLRRLERGERALVGRLRLDRVGRQRHAPGSPIASW